MRIVLDRANSNSMEGGGEAVERDRCSREVLRFLADVVELAGGHQAVSLALHELGFSGKEGPLGVEAIRAYLRGARTPEPAVLFALARRFELSLDEYALTTTLRDEINDLRKRLRVVEERTAEERTA